jgi:hypothetical protein
MDRLRAIEIWTESEIGSELGDMLTGEAGGGKFGGFVGRRFKGEKGRVGEGDTGSKKFQVSRDAKWGFPRSGASG